MISKRGCSCELPGKEEGDSGTFHALLGKEKEEIRESVGEKWQRLRKG